MSDTLTLIQLTYDQISSMWDSLKGFVHETLPTVDDKLYEHRLNNILQELLMGKAQLWVGYRAVEVEQHEPIGFVITYYSINALDREKNLLVYSLYGFQSVSLSWMVQGLETLTKFAKTMGLHNVILYTDNPAILKYLERSGRIKSQQVFVKLEV